MGDESTKAIGLFWDIENCQVPRYVSALSIVLRLREQFFPGLREAEFMCVCDINKEQKNVVEELNSGQVNVVHVSATAKNAADDKIKQSLRRFADTHPPDTKIILISGDVNFSSELSDLRHRKCMYIILIHKKQVNEALTHCAHEHYIYDDLLADLPRRLPTKAVQDTKMLVARGFPTTMPKDMIRKRLTALSSNCGGRVVQISQDMATLLFPTTEAAFRAKRRMENEDVYGLPITLNTCRNDEAISAALSPTKFNKRLNSNRSRSESREGHQHGDAPGAPGNSSPVKKSGSAFSAGYSSHATSGQSAFVTQSSYSAYQAPNSYGEDGSADLYHSSVKEADFSHAPSHSMIPHPGFPDHPDNQSGFLSDAQALATPNLSEPPPMFSGFPLSSADGGIPGTLNISKTYNVTYQQSYTPRMYHPQPVYPYQQQNALRPPVFNPGPRQSSKFSYEYNRPRSQNASSVGSFSNSQQIRPYNARAISSSSDMFEDDDDGDGLELAYMKAQQQADGDRALPVDLTVTNLDYNISKKEWRKILAATFQPHVQVLGICVRTQPDNTSIATVKVPSVEDARFAISQFHRRKIGYKRINVVLNDERDQAPAESTRQETIAILSDAKAYTMPVFKFIENYEKRYHKSVSVSDLYKMKDVVEIMDRGGAGRMVKLARGVCPTPSPTPEDFAHPFQDEMLDQPVCLHHCPEGSHQYADAVSMGMLPTVKVQRKSFAAHVHSLLLSHAGVMPLMSFPMCYNGEFGSMLHSSEDGVYMEHLISCVPGVEIIVSKKGVKVIHFQEKKDPPGAEAICGRTSPLLSQQMALLSREIGDLLRQSRLCSIPASKFIPAYHHHFGRQCRVADYGYTKLAELFDALPHVLQVLGTGDRKVLTLSHRAQVKRFIADVLKVLKTQSGKLLFAADLPTTYERVLFRKFDITHYGVAFLEDMFIDIPPTSIMITTEDNRDILAIPKRDQTAEEIKRTEQFALELVDLLKHNPHGRMTFNKFIPAYHHHFGRQCRVADYGFTRLTDLFESVAQVVEIVDDEEERMVKLTGPEMRLVLAEQMRGLLCESAGMVLPLDQVLLAFPRQYSFPLRLSDFGVTDVKDLLLKIQHCVYVDMKEVPPIVKLRPSEEIPLLAMQVVQLLMDQCGGALPLAELCSRYRQTFGQECDVRKVHDHLLEYVQISSENDDGSAVIRLSAMQVLGRDLRALLRKAGSVPMSNLSQVYQDTYLVELKPALYGFPEVPSLLRALPHIVKVTGRPGRKFVELSHILDSGNGEEEMVQLDRVSSISRFEDPLSAPVPSNVPSPILFPNHNNLMPDLMNFDNPDYSAALFDLSEDDKRGLRTPLCQTPTSFLQANFSPFSDKVFPGEVPLSSPFPPPPSFPVDMPPPNLSAESQQWPRILRQPPSSSAHPLLSSSAPNPDLPPPALTVSRAAAPSSGAGQLTAAALQWKERLEGGGVNFTPQQLTNLARMKLLLPGQQDQDKPRPVSAPTYDAAAAHKSVSAYDASFPADVPSNSASASAYRQPGAGSKHAESAIRAIVKSDAGSGSEGQAGSSSSSSAVGSNLSSSGARKESVEDSWSMADPCIIQSSLHSAPTSVGPPPQPGFEVPFFGGGRFMEFKVASPPTRAFPRQSLGAGLEEEQDVSRQPAEDGESLAQAFAKSLGVTQTGEGDTDSTLLDKSLPRTASSGSVASQGQVSCPADASGISPLSLAPSLANGKAASPAPLSPSSSSQELGASLPKTVMTSAGDASSSGAPSVSGATSSSLCAGAFESSSSSSAAIPANDSFCLDQPLDTSSTRSGGSVSDTLSASPSPRKNPRRARLAAKFFSAGPSQ